jgi:hypothetical protein
MLAVETDHCSTGRMQAESCSSSSRSSQQARTWDVPAPVASWLCLGPVAPPESVWPFAHAAGRLIEADLFPDFAIEQTLGLDAPSMNSLSPHTDQTPQVLAPLHLRPHCDTDLAAAQTSLPP